MRILLCSSMAISSRSFSPSDKKSLSLAKPDITFIMTDDLVHGNVGFNENSHIKTPVLFNLLNKAFNTTSYIMEMTELICPGDDMER